MRWRAVWPLPVLLLGVVLLAGGIATAIVTRSRPDPGSPLADAASRIAAGEYESAISVLNERALPLLSAGSGGVEDQARFFRMRAASIFAAQSKAGIKREENWRAIVDDFASAERKGARLGSQEVLQMTTAQVALGETRPAAERARALAAADDPIRRRILKAIVERNLASPNCRFDETIGVLAEISQAPGAPPPAPEAAWTLARQAELLLLSSRPEEAIAKLLREMQRIRGVEPKDEAELYYLLGRAYDASGQPENAEQNLVRAAGGLDSAAPLRAEIGLVMGRLRQAAGRFDEAKERFAQIIAEHPASGACVPALVGLGSAEAALGNDEAALKAFSEVIERLPKAEPRAGLNASGIGETLMTRYANRLQSGRVGEALRYALLAESLWARDRVPAPVLLAVASTNRRIADELVVWSIGAIKEIGSSPVKSAPVDAATREEAKRAYLAAGDYYLRHSQAVLVEDAAGAAASLWSSADSYDLGGGLESAVKGFGGFLQSSPDDDARRPEAKFRLAQVFEAQKDFGTAAAFYRELIDARGDAARLSGSAVWADRSMVPLARCVLHDSDPGNDGAAEESLREVLSGRSLAPDAIEFRSALVELANLYYGTGRYGPAIERLREAVDRFPDDAEMDTLLFELADSERLSGAEIDKTLREAMPEGARGELASARAERRKDAAGLYERVRERISAVDPARRTDLQKMYLRNSVFGLGDCAYDAGDFAGAVRAYDQARQQYADDPASLVALVQTASAYVGQGEWAKAAAANERARQHLAKFPDSVWLTPNLPMEKKHWERWLDSRALLEQRAQAGP